jgi:hypothetical protein
MKPMNRFAACLLPLIVCAPLASGGGDSSTVNFSHLRHLTEQIRFQGQDVDIIHVYANYPDYRWVGAAESGPEGVACVDDAARAAVVYLRHYRLSGDSSSLERARPLLRFVKAMQTDGGRFTNFIRDDHSVNREGPTSVASFGWWAARGVWSMACGFEAFRTVDPSFAAELRRGVERSLPHVDSLLVRYGQIKTIAGFRTPLWLLYESGADVTSELILGLTEFLAATGNEHVEGLIRRLADGLLMMQDGDAVSFPFGLHRSWESTWHLWGNGQTLALATAGMALRDTVMIRSAEREAVGFYSRLLIRGLCKEMDVADTSRHKEYEQIAYGIKPMAVGLVRLFEATGKHEYLAMAGIAASWLCGNNVLRQPMYDPSTGRCYDGITDASTINRNSGAESTIEALWTLIEVERYPEARQYLTARRLRTGQSAAGPYAVFSHVCGDLLVMALDTHVGKIKILKGVEADAFLAQHE